MLSRKDHQEEGKEFSGQWTQQILNTLNDVYSDICQKQEGHLKAYGRIYSNEILFIVSMLKKSPAQGLPLSFFISLDYNTSQRDERILDKLIDFAGLLLEETFPKLGQNGETDEIYSAKWDDHEIDGQRYYFKITREDVESTLLANEFLAKH